VDELPEVPDVPEVPEVPELGAAEVAARLGSPGFFVIDNNGAGRWRRSHVPGAKNLNPYNFEATDLPADRAATLVFYCLGPG
jgi:hypothetical protein